MEGGTVPKCVTNFPPDTRTSIGIAAPTADSGQAYQAPCVTINPHPTQLWRYEHMGDGAYLVRNQASNRCLTIRDWDPGTPVILQACINVDGQQHWYPQDTGTGTGDIWLTNADSYLCLRVPARPWSDATLPGMVR